MNAHRVNETETIHLVRTPPSRRRHRIEPVLFELQEPEPHPFPHGRILVAFLVMLMACLALSGCGNGGYAGGGISGLSSSAFTLDAGQVYPVTATISGGNSVSWALSCTTNCGTLSATTGATISYNASPNLTTQATTTLTASILGTQSKQTVAITVNPDPTISGTPPSGTMGTPYSAALTASGGTAPLKWSVTSGVMPAGLSFNTSTGAITGTPSEVGTSTFTVQIVDSSVVPFTVTASKSIVIAAAGPPLAVSGAPPAGTVGTPYSTAFVASGGTVPYTFSVISGAVPAGLTLSGSTGVLSGTPSAAGTSNFTIQVQDAAGVKATGAYSITVATGSTPLTIGLSTLPNGKVNVPYSSPVGVSGGTPPYSCAVTAGTLPAGLVMGAGCVVSGTPTVAGTSNVTIMATDSASPAATTSKAMSITIAPAAVVIVISSPPTATAGTPYNGPIPVTGGTGPYSCALVTGTLPAGLTLGANCVITGTPTTPGSTTVTVTGTDSGNPPNSGTGPITVTVAPAGTTLTISSPPTATVGTPYTGTIPVAGGTGPYSCSVTAGTLPAGLALGANCVIAGTPTTAGSTTLTIKGTDSATPQNTGTGPITITIAAAPTLVITSPPGATVGTPYTGVIPVTGGTGPYSCSLTVGTLPAGLTLGANCTISGTPTTAGSTNVTVKATDSSTPTTTSTGPVTITVSAAPVTLTLSSPPNATVGTPYTGTIGVTGGTAPYSCTLAGGTLPAGLTLGAACTITGTPTTAGTSTVSITATDTSTPTKTTTGPVSITVLPVPPLVFTGTLPNAILNLPYTQTLHASGGVGPYTYAVTAGTLPAGITLSSAGVVSGTPTVPGASSFTVTATDSESTPQTAALPLILLVVYPTTPNDGELTGPYAFLFQGYDDQLLGVLAYQTQTVGSFVSDGTGVLTTGELDSNHQSSTSTTQTIASNSLLGTYTIGTDHRGSLTITSLKADGTVNQTSTYAVSLKAPVAPATTTTRASMIEFDNNNLAGTKGSGSILQQTAAAFTSSLTGNFAFGLQGDTPCLPTCTIGISAGPVAAVGQFTGTAAGLISAGTGDENIASTNMPNAGLSGNYGTVDSSGRLQMSLTTTGTPNGVYPTDYAVYMVSADQGFILSTDKHSAYILLGGSFQRQATATFSNASLTGAYLGYENSPTNPGLVGATLQNVLNLSTATVFRGTADAAGNCTTTNVDQGGLTGLVNGLTGLGSGAPILNALLGTYASTGNSGCTVAPNGRAVLNYPAPSGLLPGILALLGLSNTPPPARVAYLTAPNQGYFLETGYAGLGKLAAQTGAPFSVATLHGTYVYGQAPASSVATINSSGTFVADGAGHATSDTDLNVGVGTLNILQLGVTTTSNYTLTDATAGRYLLGTNTVIYAISPTEFVLLDTNPLTTSPSVVLLY